MDARTKKRKATTEREGVSNADSHWQPCGPSVAHVIDAQVPVGE